MSDEAPESKIDDINLQLLRNLEQRSVIKPYYIRRELFTGGEYRQTMSEISDAMLALGGGKGTYSAGSLMIGSDKPVLPIDLHLGSIVEDGEGAVALYKEMMSDPAEFLPGTHSDSKSKIGPAAQQYGKGVAALPGFPRFSAEGITRFSRSTPRTSPPRQWNDLGGLFLPGPDLGCSDLDSGVKQVHHASSR